MIDLDDKRLAVAKTFGATHVVNSGDGKASEAVRRIAGRYGVDAAIEAVGIPATFELCEQLVGPGGHLANVGVHGKPVILHLELLWDRNITITTRLVDTSSMPMILRTVRAGKIDPTRLISHHFKLSDIIEAYETFATAETTGAVKVLLEA
jgi:alcohol dehydrogenase